VNLRQTTKSFEKRTEKNLCTIALAMLSQTHFQIKLSVCVCSIVTPL